MKKCVDGKYVVNATNSSYLLIEISIKEMEYILKEAKKTHNKLHSNCFMKHLNPNVTFIFNEGKKRKK